MDSRRIIKREIKKSKRLLKELKRHTTRYPSRSFINRFLMMTDIVEKGSDRDFRRLLEVRYMYKNISKVTLVFLDNDRVKKYNLYYGMTNIRFTDVYYERRSGIEWKRYYDIFRFNAIIKELLINRIRRLEKEMILKCDCLQEQIKLISI